MVNYNPNKLRKVAEYLVYFNAKILANTANVPYQHATKFIDTFIIDPKVKYLGVDQANSNWFKWEKKEN